MKKFTMNKFLSFAFISFAILAAPAFAETTAGAPDAKTVTPPVAAHPAAAPAAAHAATPGAPGAVPAAAPAATPGQPAAAAAPNPNAIAPTTPQLPVDVLTDEAVEDTLKDIVMHKRPNDFAGAQQLAVQNRQERMEMLQKSMECVQKAATVEDLYACQADERKNLDKIWLSYCDTTVSFLGTRRVAKNNNGKGNPQLEARPKASECDRAMAAVTGRPVYQKPAQDVQQ